MRKKWDCFFRQSHFFMIMAKGRKYMCKRLHPFLLSFCAFFLIFIALAANCDKGAGPRLVKFDGGTVLESEYIERYLLSTQYKPNAWPTEENLKEIVQKKALDKIFVLEAMARGLDKDSTFQAMVRNQGRKIVFYKYMQQEIFSQVITDSLIRLFYDHYSPQYDMKYIMRPVVKSSTAEFERSQQDTIEIVYRLLKSGKKFADLAKKYSQDITTNQKGGDLGFVIRESMGDAMLRTVMDTLQDFSYSKPIRGYEGYYILYKGEKRIVPVPAFSKVKDRIWQTLYRTRRHNIQQAIDRRFSQLAEKYHYALVDNVKKAILDKVGVDEHTLEYKLLDFSALTDSDLSQPLARYDFGVIRVAELFKERKRAPQNLAEFNERISALAEQHLLGQHGLDLGVQNDPETMTQINMFRESLLKSNLLQVLVFDKVKARIDSLQITFNNQFRPEEVNKPVAQKYQEYEQELKGQVEESLKSKYRFHYLDKNFAQAMTKARVKKEEQNKKTSQAQADKTGQ